MSKKPVSFHDDPPAETDYQKAIRRAKANQRAKPADMHNTPRFDQVNSSWQDIAQEEKRQKELSQSTQQNLKAVQEFNAVQDSPEPIPMEESKVVETPQEELSAEDKLKARVEKTLEPLDIGQYIMGGELKQAVEIIPGKLVVVFKTVTDAEEAFVDDKIAQDRDITTRQLLRRLNEYALATHIYSVNNTKWPVLVDKMGRINEEAIESRVAHIKKLSSPIFNMLAQNLGWFLDRVQDALTVEALGNG